jgi:hypothetical protein
MPRTKKRTKLFSFFSNILIFLAISLVCVLLLEVFVRVFMPQNPVQFYADEKVGYIHEPNLTLTWCGAEFKNTFKVNSKGFLDHECSLEKPDGTFRILLLGDSFAEAEQVPSEKAFGHVLERELNQRSDPNGTRFEVMNTGVGGYGTSEEYLVLKNYGLQYKPDLVIMMLYTENDIRNNYFDQGRNKIIMRLDANGSLYVNRSTVKPYSSLERFVGKTSQLAYVLYFNVYTRIPGMFSGEDSCPIDYKVYDKEYDADWKEAFRLTEKLITESDKVSRGSGAPFVIVTLTNRNQLDKKAFNMTLKKYPCLVAGNMDLEKPDKTLRDFCAESGLSCVNLLWTFKNYTYATGVKLHYDTDAHWNAEGHALAEKEVLAYLDANGLVPPASAK